MIEKIIGSKTKLKILPFILKQDVFSIRQASVATGVAYSVCYKDIHEFVGAGFVAKAKDGFSVDRKSAHYGVVEGIFSGESSAGVSRMSSARKKELGKMMELLNRYGHAAVVVHHNADPDSMGSAIALSRALFQKGIKTEIFAPDGISRQSASILKKYPYPIVDGYPEKEYPAYIIVDASTIEQIGNMEFPKESGIIVVDHHQKGKLAESAQALLVDTGAHSTAGIVYSIIEEAGMRMTKEISFFLLCALVADTAFFRIADRNDLEIAVMLLRFNNLSDIVSVLSVPEDISLRIAKMKAFRRSDTYNIGGFLVAFSRTGSFESQVALSLVRTACDIAVVINTKNEGDMRISARMRPELKERLNLVDVLKVIEPVIEGSAGGHDMAASANGKNTNCVREAKEMLIRKFESALKGRAKPLN